MTSSKIVSNRMTLLCRKLLSPGRLKRHHSSVKNRRYCTVNDGDGGGETVAHTPVMVDEVIEYLNLKPGNVFIDMTFGAGGHSKALLEKVPELKVIALDRDPTAEEFAKDVSEKYPDQVMFLCGKFSELPRLLDEKGVHRHSIDGILFDLGVSSMQFDNAERGFAITRNGPLDMRMDGGRKADGVTAADVIAYATENELYQIFKVYGQERKSRKIAKGLKKAQTVFQPLKTTKDLSDLVEAICSDAYRDKLQRKASRATKVFQALRIFVNNELNELNYGIRVAHKFLKTEGRAVVITFHSLEDAIVKGHFKNGNFNKWQKTSASADVGNGAVETLEKKNWHNLTKKVVVPTFEEILHNPRSRSAKLRAAIKVLS